MLHKHYFCELLFVAQPGQSLGTRNMTVMDRTQLQFCPVVHHPVFFFDGAIFGDFDPDRMIASRYKDFAAFRFKGL